MSDNETKQKRKKTPSFITELELNTTAQDEITLEKRLEAARQLYNAVLGESLKRLAKMRESRYYRKAKAQPRTVKGKPNKERSKLFNEAREVADFKEYSLHAFATTIKHSWIGEHLDANTVQTVATRAYRAVNEYTLGKRGRPRFKGKGRIKSVEGKTNKQGIVLRDGSLIWNGLSIPLLVKPNDAVQAHGLNSPVKYVRIVKREIRGRTRWFAQLVNEGQPYRKPKNVTVPGIVGLDIGPSTVAVVSADYAELYKFCDGIDDLSNEIAKLQRQIERQRRQNNPTNYEPDRWVKNANGNWEKKQGKIKPGHHRWVVSKRMKSNQAKLATLHHRLAAQRKSLHGRLVNTILAQGTTVRTEKLSYRAFQRRYGKSVGVRAPGMFVSLLRRKAANAGGGVEEFSTYSTRLSQTCLCGTIAKKALSERWHNCDCGIVQQRDLFSAFLAACVEDDRLVAHIAQQRYVEIDYALRAAASRNKSVIGQAMPANFLDGSQNGSSASVQTASKAQKVEQLSLFPLGELAALAEPPSFSYGE